MVTPEDELAAARKVIERCAIIARAEWHRKNPQSVPAIWRPGAYPILDIAKILEGHIADMEEADEEDETGETV